MSSRTALGNVVLVGFMGAGKSSVGRRVARQAGLRFIDTDQLVSGEAGMPIPAIFERHGETHFRELETSVLHSLQSARGSVVSTGGGIVVERGNRPLLRSLGLVVWLSATPEVIFERISRNRNRPLLQTANPFATVVALLKQREVLYKETADLHIDTTGLSHDEVASRIIRAREQQV